MCRKELFSSMDRKTPTYSSRFTSQDVAALYGTRPATSAAQTVPCPDGYLPYTLQTGDTLYAIAMTHGITVNELLFYNPGLNPYDYRAGQSICVPAVGKPPATDVPATPDEGPLPLPTPSLPADPPEQNGSGDAPDAPTEPACENGVLYTVRAGDTLRTIARRFGLTLSALMEANPGNTNNRLTTGQKLCIPQNASAPCCPEGTSAVRAPSADFVDLLINYNISYAALTAANPHLDVSMLYAGQTVCVPPAGSRGSCADAEGTLELTQDITAVRLAQELNTTVARLMRSNPVFLPTDFRAGRIICIPKAEN